MLSSYIYTDEHHHRLAEEPLSPMSTKGPEPPVQAIAPVFPGFYPAVVMIVRAGQCFMIEEEHKKYYIIYIYCF